MNLMILFVSGCAITQRNECLWVKEFSWTQSDAEYVSIDLAKQLKIHNQKYQEFCKK
jgi:hypothetical protein